MSPRRGESLHFGGETKPKGQNALKLCRDGKPGGFASQQFNKVGGA